MMLGLKLNNVVKGTLGVIISNKLANKSGIVIHD